MICAGACRSIADCGDLACSNGACAPAQDWRMPLLLYEDRPAPIEIAPWLHAAAGVRWLETDIRKSLSLGAGVEGTFRLGAGDARCTARGRCPYWRARVGTWIGIDTDFSMTRMEGGAALNLGGPQAFSLSTFGARIGVGHDSSAGAHVVGQLSWGTRSVAMRRTEITETPCRPIVALASGLRIFLVGRHQVDGPARSTLTLGLEWQPLGWGVGLLPR
jgi:hypothetical protein